MAPESNNSTNGDALKDAPPWFKLAWFAFSKGGLTFVLVVGIGAYAYLVAIPESDARREALVQQGHINVKMVEAVEAMHGFMGNVKDCHDRQNVKLDTISTQQQSMSVSVEQSSRKIDDLKRAVETARSGG